MDHLALPIGTVIVSSAKQNYTITELIGRGGSAFVYAVEETGNGRRLLLKEACPNHALLRIHRIGADLQAENQASALELEACRASMRREQVFGAQVEEVTRRAVGLWNLLEVTEILISGEPFQSTDGVFALLPDLRKQGLFLHEIQKVSLSLHEISKLMECVCTAVAKVHESGFLFGDVSPGNVLCEYAPGSLKQHFDLAILIDFGASQKVNDDGKCQPQKTISFSSRFAAPELFSEQNRNGVQLTLAYDVFSLGCLFLYFLNSLPKESSIDGLRNTLYLSVRPEVLSERGSRPAAIQQGLAIIEKSLNPIPEERYQNAVEMLEEIKKLVQLSEPPRYHLNPNLTTSTHWVDGSREAELKDLQERLDAGEKPIWIQGIGGIGKTELAIRFALQQRTLPVDQRREAYFVVYRGSMLETIRALIPEYSLTPMRGESEEQRKARELQELLAILRDYYADALFVVDNFDSEEKTLSQLLTEEACKAFLSLPIHVLFTTRFRANSTVSDLDKMPEEHLLTLFRECAWNATKSVTNDEILELIGAVRGHSLTVELLATTLEESWGTVMIGDLLTAIRASELDSEQFPEVISDKDRTYRKGQILQHLKAVFNLSSLDEAQKRVLCHAFLLPEGGMSAELFLRAEQAEEKIALKKLEKRHWLKRRDNLLMIHPLIREVVLHENKPSFDLCSVFLDLLWDQYLKSDQDYSFDGQMIPVFLNAHRLLLEDDFNANSAYRAARIEHTYQKRLIEAQALAEFAAETREKRGDFNGAAIARRLLCRILLDLGDELNKARDMARMAYELNCVKCDSFDLESLALDYEYLSISNPVFGLNAFLAAKACLLVRAVLLNRVLPELEDITQWDAISVDQGNERSLQFDFVLLPREYFHLKQEKSSAQKEHIPSFGEFKRLMEVEFSTKESANNAISFETANNAIPFETANNAIPFETANNAIPFETANNAIPFSFDAYLRMVDYCIYNNRAVKAKEKYKSFLNAFHNYVCGSEQYTRITLEEQKKAYSRIALAFQTISPETSCAVYLLNVGAVVLEIANQSNAGEHSKEALEEYKQFALRALKEAEKDPDDMVYVLAALSDVSLDLWECETKYTKDLTKIEKYKRDAEQYASEAIKVCQDRPAEPEELRKLRRRFSSLKIPLDCKDFKKSVDFSLEELFSGTDESRSWYRSRQEKIEFQTKYTVLRRYRVVIGYWLRMESPSLRQQEKANEDYEWLDNQLSLMKKRPSTVVFLPYHIAASKKKIIKNAIRCKFCRDVLESSGAYATHKIQVCSCGQCGIDGGHFALIRFTRTPDQDYFEELSILE